jgi:hypothetical protein
MERATFRRRVAVIVILYSQETEQVDGIVKHLSHTGDNENNQIKFGLAYPIKDALTYPE